MQFVSCNICGSKDSSDFLTFKNPKTAIVTCASCGMKYLNPIPQKNERFSIYSKFYFQRETAPNDVSGYRSYIEDQYIHNYYFSKILKKIKMTRGHLLEIGCATGFFLNVARSKGFKVEGIEISKFAAEYAQKKFGLKVWQREFKDFTTDQRYDLIVLFQTIEHLDDPLGTMKHAYELLKKGSTVVITTPNQQSLIAKIFGKRWFEYKPTEHFFYFSPNSIKKLLKITGFKKINVSSDIHYLSAEYISERIRYYFPFLRPLATLLEKTFKLLHLEKKILPFDKGSMIITAEK